MHTSCGLSKAPPLAIVDPSPATVTT
jgi:hypothetical protein